MLWGCCRLCGAQSRGLGFAKALDLKQALGEELEEGVPYTLWPRLVRQVLGASVLVSERSISPRSAVAAVLCKSLGPHC